MKLLIFLIIIEILFINLIFSTIESKFDKIPETCNIITIDKCFVISLFESVNRRNNFLKSYKLDIPLEIIYGINTKNKENAEKYKYLVNPEKFNNMYSYDKGELRPDHTYFNSGALGSYLSHMEFYKRCFEQNLNYAIVFEDNVLLDQLFEKELNYALERLGDDFDVCFFHCFNNISEKVIKCSSQINKIKFITSAKCYLINVNRMKKYYNLFYPINNHIDLSYEKIIYNGADIYLININSINLQSNSKSTINHSGVKNQNRLQYLDKDENKNIKPC